MQVEQDVLDYFGERGFQFMVGERTGAAWFENQRDWMESGTRVLHWHDGKGWTPVVPGSFVFADCWFDDPISAYVYAETAGWQ